MSAAFSDFHSRPQKHGLVIFNVPRELTTSNFRLELLAFGGLEYFDRHDDATAGNVSKSTGAYSCKVTFFQQAAAEAARAALNGTVRYGRKLRVERRNIAKGKRGLYAHKTCVSLLNDELPLRWSTTIVDVSTGPVRSVTASGSTGPAAADSASDSDSGKAKAGSSAAFSAFVSDPVSMAAQGGRMLLHRTVLRGLGPSSFPGRAGASAGAGAGMQQDGLEADGDGHPGEDDDADGEGEGAVFGARFVLRGEGRAGSSRFVDDDDDDGEAAGVLAGSASAAAAASSESGVIVIDARRSRWVKDGVGRRGDWTAAFASARFAAAGLPLRNALEASRGAPPQCFRSGVVPIPVCGQLPPQLRGTGVGAAVGAGAGAGAITAGASAAIPIPGSSACAHVSVMLTLHGSDGFTDHVQGIGGCDGPATAAASSGSTGSGAGAGAGGTSSSSSAGGAAAWRPCPSSRRGMHRSKPSSSSADAEGGDWPDQHYAPLRLHTGALIPGRYRDCFGSSGGLGSSSSGVGADAVPLALAGPYESRRDDGAPRLGRPAAHIYTSMSSGCGGGHDYDGGNSDDSCDYDGDDDDDEEADDAAGPRHEREGAAAGVHGGQHASAYAPTEQHHHRPGHMPEDEGEGEGSGESAEPGLHADAAAGMHAGIGIGDGDAALETATTREGEDAFGEQVDAAEAQAADGASCASSCSGCREEAEDENRSVGDEDYDDNSDCSDADDADGAFAAVIARARAAVDFGHTFGVPLPLPSLATAAASTTGEGVYDDDGAPLPPAPAPAPERPAVRFLSAREDLPTAAGLAAGGAGAHPPAAGIVDLSAQLEELRHAIALEATYAANGNAAAAARLKVLRAQQAKLAAHTDRRGMEAAWAARGYSGADIAEGKHVRRASEMALRDACRQFMLRRPLPSAAGAAYSEA